MANRHLFASATAPLAPARARNREGAPAYAYGPRHRLAQLAVTGTLHDGVYGSAEAQLADVLAAAQACDPLFVAKAAIHARRQGHMKDMPALLAAWLTVADPDLAMPVFRRVIDNGRMVRSFVQIVRSGLVGRRSLGTRPKRLVTQWLETAGLWQLLRAATGTSPSLADIVRMVHPRPQDAERRAFYGWLIGKPYDVAALPEPIADFEAWKREPGRPLPDVPWEWLTAFDLTAEQWAVLASRMGWQALRMNLNTLARHGAFGVGGTTEMVAARLGDGEAMARSRVLPYQLLAAIGQVGDDVPEPVRRALETALEASVARLPRVAGRVVVCPDVSGSMAAPMTGSRRGASSKVRCIDVAALVASAMLRHNPDALVLPFEQHVVEVALSRDASIAANARVLAGIGGGGTAVSAPLAWLNARGLSADLVVIVSDNQSWVDPSRMGATATLAEWRKLKRRCGHAKLVCIDVAPYGTTQAQTDTDIMNVGGFSDAVFTTVARFARGEATSDWVAQIEQTEVTG